MDLKLFLNNGNNGNETFEYTPTQKFKDSNGKAIPWVFKKLSIEEYEAIRDECTSINFADKGKTKFQNTLFNKKIVCNSVVEPNLNNAELQDSYGVKKPEDLITKLFDNVGEYLDLINYLLNMNGFKSASEYSKEAKN